MPWPFKTKMPQPRPLHAHHCEQVVKLDGAEFLMPPEATHANRHCEVIEIDARVASFVTYDVFPSRIEIVRLAVTVNQRRRGIARSMIERIKNLACAHGLRVRAYVPEGNYAALDTFRACGLLPVNLVRFNGPIDIPFRNVGDLPRAIVVAQWSPVSRRGAFGHFQTDDIRTSAASSWAARELVKPPLASDPDVIDSNWKIGRDRDSDCQGRD